MRAKLIKNKEGQAIRFYMDVTNLSDQKKEDFKQELVTALGDYGTKSEWKLYTLIVFLICVVVPFLNYMGLEELGEWLR